MKDIIFEIDQWLSLNRGSLSCDEVKMLEDCKELALLIEGTTDEKLKKIHTLDLTIKISTFFRQ